MTSAGRFGRVGVVLGVCAAACASPQKLKQEAVYGPSESVLEVVAVLRRHVPDDTYRFPPATGFTGRNIYRATLLRLENLERIHEGALRAGHMDAVIDFAKARALERLRAYDLAAEHYAAAARRAGALRAAARRGERICAELAAALDIGIDLVDPLAPRASGASADSREAGLSLDAEAVVADLDERVARLSALLELGEDERDAHYAFIVQQEIERADVTRARYFLAMRNALADGTLRAVAELRRVIGRHAPSVNHGRHVLALADLYATLADEYVRARPPEGLRFDPATFQELVDAASRLYQMVAGRDGTPEKLEAARRFEAFLAFTLQVDRDRFTQ